MNQPATESGSQKLELFLQALDLENERERAAFLDSACGSDAPLRDGIDALLRHHHEDSFLEQPAVAVGPGCAFATAPLSEKPGDRIGRYQLLEKIGEGGCGVVYMAGQEEPVRRRVALKIIKPGMDSREVIARFEAERQALAMMDHPNIAKVHDGGVTGTGRPYFVMELVRGVRITDYCQEYALTTRDRLDLFLQVCSAVQHAHQKGIIHRDLKPSNILVSGGGLEPPVDRDGGSQPPPPPAEAGNLRHVKVIDFGIARATDQKLTDKTFFTQFSQFVGTPAYMSPEQAGLAGADIDTRSDIYSLGVLLYELLTGTTPFNAKELLQAGFDEMRRIIRETEPPKPSTRLTQTEVRGRRSEVGGRRSEVGGRRSEVGGRRSAIGDRKSEVGGQRSEIGDRGSVTGGRQSETGKPKSKIESDLDWIVMKCLEKDRGRRYETATGLAQDIQRHLGNETVTARPPTAAYRLRKMVRRNKSAVAAGAAVLAALVFGLGVSVWQSIEKSRALTLLQAAQKAEREERRKAEAEAEKSKQVAQFLQDMLRGVHPSVAQGRDTKMLQDILNQTADRIGADLKDQPEVEAEIRTVLGKVYSSLGDYEKASTMLGGALEMTKSLRGEEHKDVVYLLTAQSHVLTDMGKLAEAEATILLALDMDRKLAGPDGDVSTSLNSLGLILSERGRYPEAAEIHREALDMRRKFSGNDHEDTANSLNNLAVVLQDQQNFADSETLLREALAIQKKLLGPEHPDVAITLNNLSNAVQAQHKFKESETLLLEVLPLQRKLLGNAHPNVAAGLNGLGLALLHQDRAAEAEPILREAVEIEKNARSGPHPQTGTCVGNLGRVMEATGQYPEAETLYQEAIDIYTNLPGAEHPHTASWRNQLFNLLHTQEKWPELETLMRESLESARRAASGDGTHPAIAEALVYLAYSLINQKKFPEAETFLLEANEALQLKPAEHRKLQSDALSSLVSLYEAWEQTDKAAAWRGMLAAFASTNTAPDGEPKAETSKY